MCETNDFFLTLYGIIVLLYLFTLPLCFPLCRLNCWLIIVTISVRENSCLLLNKTDREGRKKNQNDRTYHVITCHAVRIFNLMSEKRKRKTHLQMCYNQQFWVIQEYLISTHIPYLAWCFSFKIIFSFFSFFGLLL